MVTADGTEILADGAEDGDGPWTADGFVRSQDRVHRLVPAAVLDGEPSARRSGRGLRQQPVQLPRWRERTRTWVEHFAYQTDGVLLWYNWDAYGDNNVSGHPGVGLILPIDVQAEPLLWDDDANPATSEFLRNRVQSYDAALSLEDTPEITLHRPHAEGGDTATTWGGLPAVSMFDDVNGVYWYEDRPSHGVLLEPIGTTVELISMNEQCDGTSSATLSINGADVSAPEPVDCESPTPTLPPTGGDSSSSLAGIGLAAVLAGGLLVALAARRLRQD